MWDALGFTLFIKMTSLITIDKNLMPYYINLENEGKLFYLNVMLYDFHRNLLLNEIHYLNIKSYALYVVQKFKN